MSRGLTFQDGIYDPDLDYLTEVDYNDGLANEVQTWTYDAAGNRATDSVQGSGWSYDNLNRILTSPGYVYEHDILGNRTWRNRQVSAGGVKYVWDELNRASSIVGTSSGARYEYRADGMRTDKVEGFNLSWEWTDKTHTSGYYDEIQGQNLPTSRYYYDGQMMVEDDYTVEGQNEPVVTVMRYGIGARGIDFLAKSVDGGAETLGFPLYDGHGNMIATLGRDESSPYFGVADLRSYDAWGAVRSGSTTGDPKQRYCASLGHIQDDESGLLYMRARYYEPWSGRFISEDPDRADVTAFSYCRNSPTAFVDSSGRGPEEQIAAILANALSYLSRVYTRDAIVTVGNSLIRQLHDIAAFQNIRAKEFRALATVARATGAVEAARTYEALGAKALAYAAVAEAGVLQIRYMMAIAEQIMDIGIP